MGNFFRELRRRNVFRVAALYAVVGWLLVQVAVALESAMQMPLWFDAVVTSFLLIGFPIAVILAWAFEMTPQGVKRTAAVAPEDSITDKTARRLDYILLSGLVVVAGIVVADRFVPHMADSNAVAQTDSAPDGVNLNDKSIAVLPFADMSAEGDQEYFADGLSEELLNVLAQIDDLQVAGRTSSFAFKKDDRDLREIGEILNVAHILEGSVRKSGNQIRVTAQLINTSTGFHIYSETFEGDLSDIFKVQDDIARDITSALRTEWLGEDAIEEDAPSHFAAFDLYLRARQLIYTRDKQKMEEAERLLDKALEADPGYGPALAQKSIVNILLSAAPGSYGDRPQTESAKQSLDLAEKAIVLDSTLGEAYAAKGLALSNSNADLETVIATLRHAVDLNPGLTDAKNWLASALVQQGEVNESREVYESIVENDPLFGPAFNNLIQDYTYTGNFDKAEALIDRMERFSGKNSDTLMARGFIYQAKGELAEAAKLLGQAMDLDPNSTVLRSRYAYTMASLGAYDIALEEAMIYQKPVALMMLGRTEEALAGIEELPTPRDGGAFILGLILYVYDLGGQPEEAIVYFNRYFDDLEEPFEMSPFDADEWLTSLATAYRDTGQTEKLGKALGYLEKSIKLDKDAGASRSITAGNDSILEALRGNHDKAIEYLQEGMGEGWVSDFALRSSTFDPMRTDPRFNEIEAEMNRRVVEERTKLGLPSREGM